MNLKQVAEAIFGEKLMPMCAYIYINLPDTH